MLVWWIHPAKSKSMTTRTLSLSMASPLRMTPKQRSKWSRTRLDSTRISMATSVLNLFITWMNAFYHSNMLSDHSCIVVTKILQTVAGNLCIMSVGSVHAMVVLNLWHCCIVWYGVNVLRASHIVCTCFCIFKAPLIPFGHLSGHSVPCVPVAWGSLGSLMERETLATAPPTPPSPTTATMASEGSCHLLVSRFFVAEVSTGPRSFQVIPTCVAWRCYQICQYVWSGYYTDS